MRFGLAIGTLQDWEHARRTLEGAACVLPRVIEREPEAAARAVAAVWCRRPCVMLCYATEVETGAEMRDVEMADRMDEDAAPPPTTTVAAIRESLARAEADVAAGRVVEGDAVLAELRGMIAAQQAKHGLGETRR